MKRFHRLFLYIIVGFLFITIYLIAAIFSVREEEDRENLNRRPKKTITDAAEEDKKNTILEELTKAQTMKLLRQIESTNNDRLQRVEEICKKYNLGIYKSSQNKTVEHPPVPQYSIFYFDRENKLSFCPIYKAGSTTWLFNLCLLSGMKEEEVEGSKKQLSELAREQYPVLDPVDAEEAFQKTIKLITARHPFERLLSAYRDKLENTNVGREHGTLHFYKAFGSKIVKKYRPKGNNTKTFDLLNSSEYLLNPNHPKPAGIEPTFREFVMYLNNLHLAHYADDHWIPYYLYCTPCLLRYDIIAKVETMDFDQLYFIHVLGLQNKIKPRWRHRTQFLTENQSKTTVSPIAQIYFRQLTTEEIKKLYEKYRIDFELFGYEYKEYLKYAKDYTAER